MGVALSDEIVRLQGSAFEQGLQHANAIGPIERRHLLTLVDEAAGGQAADELLESARGLTPNLVASVEGLAEGLDLPFDRLWAYTARGYVAARAQEGCTVAVRAGAEPLLGKNRDFSPTHLPLQRLFAARSRQGYAWLSLGSLGSPGVYSSGMNEVGLALADTAVASPRTGPGALRYAVMQAVLEWCADVESAIRLMASMPAAMGGTVTVVDAQGGAATIEMAYGSCAVRRPGPSGWITATNHFREPAMHGVNPQRDTNADADTSRARDRWLERRAHHSSSAADLLDLLAGHAGQASLCRHADGQENSTRSATLASVVYEPAMRRAVVRLGQPCASEMFAVAYRGGWTIPPSQ